MAELETLAVSLVTETKEFKSGLDSADNIAKGWASKLGGAVGGLITGAVMVGATAAAAAVISIGTAAFDVSSQVNTATADIAASLGIPTAEAREFANVAREVYGNNFAESVSDAAEGVKAIAQQMQLAADDPSLQTMTENAFKLRDVFGVELGEGVSAAKTLMENFGLSGQEAFDMLAAGYQGGLDRSGDFLDTIGEYSTQFAAGGASADQFFALLESGAQGGMLGTDKAADAFKEFRIRIMEGTGEVASWLDSMEGIVDSGVINQIRDGNMSAVDAFELVMQGLQSIEDPIERHKAGIALMGTQYEDLGDQVVANMTTIGDWETTSAGAINSLNAKYDTFGKAVEGIWRRLVVSVSPFTDKLLELVNDAMPKVMAAFDRFDAAVGPTMQGIGSTIETVVNFVKGLFDQFKTATDNDVLGPLEYWKSWADTNLPMLQTLFQNILGAIQGFWNLFGEDILRIVNNTFNTAWTVIDTVMRTIGDLITLALQVMTGDWEGAGQTLQGIVERLWETIKTVISNQLDSIKTVITSIDWGELGRNIMQGVADGISNGAQHIINAAENAAQNALNAAKSWLGIHSPSKKAAEDVGEPFAEGVGVGAMRGLRDLAGQIDSGLASVMGDLSMPQPVMAGAGNGRSPINIYITLQGKASYEDGRAVGAGVSDELRARGLA